MPAIPDGEIQIATTTSQDEADQLNAIAKARSITRAALLRELIGRGKAEMDLDQRILDEARTARGSLTAADLLEKLVPGLGKEPAA